MAHNSISRLRIVLAEKSLPGKQSAEKMKKNPATISRWCNSDIKLPFEILLDITNILGRRYKGSFRTLSKKVMG